MSKSKDSIADDMYGYCYEECSAGEKAAVTKAFKAQATTRKSRVAGAVLVTFARVGDNGAKTSAVPAGTSIRDAADQAGFDLAEDKESIMAKSTGDAVDLDETAVDGETYLAAPEIKSA
jgi:hypothetical protein